MNNIIKEISNYFWYSQYELCGILIRRLIELVASEKYDGLYENNEFTMIMDNLNNVAHSKLEMNEEDVLNTLRKLSIIFEEYRIKWPIDEKYINFLEYYGKYSGTPRETRISFVKVSEISKAFPEVHVPLLQRSLAWEEWRIKDYIKKLLFTDFNIIQPFIISMNGEKREIIDGQQRFAIIYTILKLLFRKEVNFVPHKFLKSKVQLSNIEEYVKELIDNENEKEIIERISNKSLYILTVTKEVGIEFYIERNNSISYYNRVKTFEVISDLIIEQFSWKDDYERKKEREWLCLLLENSKTLVSKANLTFLAFFLEDNTIVKTLQLLSPRSYLINNIYNIEIKEEELFDYSYGIKCFKNHFIKTKFGNTFRRFSSIFVSYLNLFDKIINNELNEKINIESNIVLNLIMNGTLGNRYEFDLSSSILKLILDENKKHRKIEEVINNVFSDKKIPRILKAFHLFRLVNFIIPSTNSKPKESDNEFWIRFWNIQRIKEKKFWSIANDESIYKAMSTLLNKRQIAFLKNINNHKISFSKLKFKSIFQPDYFVLYFLNNSGKDFFNYKRISLWESFGSPKQPKKREYIDYIIIPTMKNKKKNSNSEYENSKNKHLNALENSIFFKDFAHLLNYSKLGYFKRRLFIKEKDFFEFDKIWNEKIREVISKSLEGEKYFD